MSFWFSVLEGFISNLLFALALLVFPAVLFGIFSDKWLAEYEEESIKRHERIYIISFRGFFVGRIYLWVDEEKMHYKYFTIGTRRDRCNTGYYYGSNNSEAGAFVMFYVDNSSRYVGQYLIPDKDNKKPECSDYEWLHV